MTSTSELKARQAAKMREIGEALVAAGYDNLDDQAAALGLSRSTTWTIIKATHKSSGLSGKTLKRMLSHRVFILWYAERFSNISMRGMTAVMAIQEIPCEGSISDLAAAQ